MNFVDGCAECQRISAEYESATMEWFRVQNQLRIAEYSRDDEMSNRIVTELEAIAKRRQGLRESGQQHIQSIHPRQAAASSQNRT